MIAIVWKPKKCPDSQYRNSLETTIETAQEAKRGMRGLKNGHSGNRKQRRAANLNVSGSRNLIKNQIRVDSVESVCGQPLFYISTSGASVADNVTQSFLWRARHHRTKR